MFLRKIKISPGTPYPLGATVGESGVNFSLFSHHAEKVVLCLFNRREHETHHIPLYRSNDIWHVFVHKIYDGQLYGYRVYGPYDPNAGHLFNHHKLLLDPMAKQITKPVVFHPSQLPYIFGHKKSYLSFSTINSAPFMPKCVVVDIPKIEKSTKPYLNWQETVIYETHVKGMTKKRKDIPRKIRGTFAGLASNKVISYLQTLGVTSLEVLPIYAFNKSQHLVEKGLSNYWGYDPVCFMAPQPNYLRKNQLSEIKKMVQDYHMAGMEVILDVVYNHSGEGGFMGALLSCRGIDNASYYRLIPNEQQYYLDDTGCGNTFDLSNPAVSDMVIQSLLYWTEVFDIDGFRFDLAVTLSRDSENQFDPQSVFFKRLKETPALSEIKLIVEPWDLGPNGYQLGNFPPIFAEWNGFFRDTVRRFWKGDMNQAGVLFEQITKPLVTSDKSIKKKINFITVHDGFSLYDLVSYNFKHNDSNQEQNRDGSDSNWSWNSGTEGHTNNPDILDFRTRRMRAMLATLFLSNGTPMILSGDEIMRTKWGNNNTYCQDNSLSWFPWKPFSKEEQHMYAFIAQLTQFQKQNPLLKKMMTFNTNNQFIIAFKPNGQPMTEEDWLIYVRCFAFCVKDSKSEFIYFIVLNASETDQVYKIPKFKSNIRWNMILETSRSLENFIMIRRTFTVPAWSVMVLKGTIRHL